MMTYGAAVKHLAEMALNQSGSGARVAASVLISANSGAFQVKIPDLCLLDGSGLDAAIVVIRSRATLRHDAERTLVNGDAVMRQIFDKWRDVLLPGGAK